MGGKMRKIKQSLLCMYFAITHTHQILTFEMAVLLLTPFYGVYKRLRLQTLCWAS